MFFETIAVAFSIFSSIPMPGIRWNEKNMKYMLLAFPLIGVVTGILCAGWIWFCRSFGLPDILMGGGLTLIPVWITGGIHLDGYVDTCDALASHQDQDKKAMILRDPHVGAFAVIKTGAYFVLMLVVWGALKPYDSGERAGFLNAVDAMALRVIMIFVISRILSALAVVSFKRTKNEDLLHVFYDYANAPVLRVLLIVLDILAVILLSVTGGTGICMAAAAHIVYLFYYRQCKREFGGVSGDQAGWFLVQAEKWMAIVLVAGCYI